MEFFLQWLGLIQVVVIGGCAAVYILGTCLVLVCVVYKLTSLAVDWLVKELLAPKAVGQ